jgi:hypothetical protein
MWRAPILSRAIALHFAEAELELQREFAWPWLTLAAGATYRVAGFPPLGVRDDLRNWLVIRAA